MFIFLPFRTSNLNYEWNSSELWLGKFLIFEGQWHLTLPIEFSLKADFFVAQIGTRLFSFNLQLVEDTLSQF
jgi:hypothetical protein